jgi:hypothetical protein
VTAKRPDGSLWRQIVKVERPGQVAVAVSCAAAPVAAAAPAASASAAAGSSDAELDAWEMSGDDKYSVAVWVNPEMAVAGFPDGKMAVFGSNTFRAMYVVIMRDALPQALIKQGFTVAEASPGDCRLDLSFSFPPSHESLLLESVLRCGSQPEERFTFSRPSENGKVMWLSPSHNKTYIEGYVTPATDELALALTRSRAVKRTAKAKAKVTS